MKEIYQMDKEALYAEYGKETGLSSVDAARILEEKGENVLEEKGKKRSWT